MIEVHAPHEATHTWTDFSIHIGTIVVGLLIAIGLEQGVEWIHHRHELVTLREDLRQEDEKALRDNADWVQFTTATLAWLDQRMELVQDAIRQHKPVPYIAPPTRTIHAVPIDPVWRAAKASNLIEVMPQQEIKAYSEIDNLIDYDSEIIKNYSPDENLMAFERQFSVSPRSGELDFSSATHADLVEELRLLSVARSQMRVLWVCSLEIDGALRAVLHGERDLDRIDDAENAKLRAH